MSQASTPGRDAAVSPYHRGADEGTAYDLFGALTLVKAGTDETGGAFNLVEQRVVAGMETPLHIHHRADELWYVIDGRISFHADGMTHSAGPGEVAFGPRGVPHAYRVEEDTRLLIVSNGDTDEFFQAIADPVTDLTPPADPTPSQAQQERLMALADEYGLEVLGPAPFDSAA